MSPSKRQSLIAMGIACLVISALLVFYGLSQPKINEAALTDLQSTLSSTAVSQSTSNQSAASVENTSASSQTTVLNTQESQSISAQNVSYPVNLNTCTYEDLISIEGIGDTKAQAILEYRDYLGGYTNVSQLKDIKGIGDATFAKIEPYVTV